jgi:hypothetical protein
VCGLIPHPGFESLSLRHTMQKPALKAGFFLPAVRGYRLLHLPLTKRLFVFFL